MRRASLVLVPALLLAACSTPPGAAATVDGESISMSDADDAARYGCLVDTMQAEQVGSTPPSGETARKNAVIGLVIDQVAASIIEADDIEVGQDVSAITTVPEADLEAFVAQFGDDAEGAADMIRTGAERQARLIAIGSFVTGQPVGDDTAAALLDAGQQSVIEAFADHDVEFAPRFGIDDALNLDADNGSLSVSLDEVDPATTGEPDDAACSA